MKLLKILMLGVCILLSQISTAENSPVVMLESLSNQIISVLKENKSS